MPSPESLSSRANASFLLRYVQTVFWLVVTVIERILPAQYYDSTMLDIIVDNQVLFSLLEIYLPRVYQHLSNYTTDLSPILTQWFLCLFVNTLPTELTLRILDCFLFEGNKILLRVALGIFKCYEADILKTESFEDLFMLIAKPINIQNADDFMALIFDRIWLRAFGREKLSQLRQNVKKLTMEEEEKKNALRRSRTAARLEAAAKEALRAVEAEAAAIEEASSSVAPEIASPSAPQLSENLPSSPPKPIPSTSQSPSAATIRADMTGTSPTTRASRFDPAKRKTIRISALPDDVKSVIDRRSWRAYKRSQEWHMIEEYFTSMDWAEVDGSVPPTSPTRPDSGSRTPLSVTDPESVPKASKTKLYKAHTVTSVTAPHVPPIAPPKISAARALASRSPNATSPTSPTSPKSPVAPATPSSSANGNEPSLTKRRSYADVAKGALDASESTSSSSSTGSPRGPPVQAYTQKKFVAATGGVHGRSVSNASSMSPKKSTVNHHQQPFRYPTQNSASSDMPPPRPNGAVDRPPPTASKKWSARQGFNTLGKNISSLVSSLTKSAVAGNSTAPTPDTSTEQKSANGSSTSANATTTTASTSTSKPWVSVASKPSESSSKPMPSGPSVPSTRITGLARQPTVNKDAAAKLHTSPPTTPAPTPPPATGTNPTQTFGK